MRQATLAFAIWLMMESGAYFGCDTTRR